MTNEENLIPIRTKEKARELGRRGGLKGGLSKSPNKKLAARLRELKKKGLSDENAKRIYNIMMDNEMSALDILLYIEGIKPTAGRSYEKSKVAELLINWQKVHHGEKRTNINVNIDFKEELRKAAIEANAVDVEGKVKEEEKDDNT